MPFVEIPKIFNLDHRIWWVIFAGSQVLIFTLMLGSIFTTKWVELETHVIKGSLLYLREFRGYSESELYSKFYTDKDCKYYHEYGLCKLIKDLGIAGDAFASFEWIGFIFLLIWMCYFINLVMKCGTFKLCCLHRPYCEAIAVVICHFLATSVWLGKSHAEFKSNCQWDGDRYDIPTICAKDGPNIAMFLMIFLPIVVTVFICVFQRAHQDIMMARAKDEQMPVQLAGYVPPQPVPQYYQAAQPVSGPGQGYPPLPSQQYPAYPQQFQGQH